MIVRRLVLLGSAAAAFAVWRLVEPNPWNLDVLERGFLSYKIVPAAIGWCLVAAEVAATARGLLIRVCALAFVVLTGVAGVVFAAVVAVITPLFAGPDSTEKVVAVSPDGRTRAVRVDYEETVHSDRAYGLILRVAVGLDRSTWILNGCEKAQGEIANVRFLGNRTLEYTPPQGPPVQVHFDRNAKADGRRCP
ncbi:hypothetical protein OG948_02975 [Embleya sp. NBC_00888]|uniref:hypothetical protein n=1 Tax=Embleya sp. NBC_00888 TaxID=2975960 RepID=UPI003863370E|nr:hypothetical protein OG948_02975 [Embleya sp. NBC_00888]